jgi:hypothetical protein
MAALVMVIPQQCWLLLAACALLCRVPPVGSFINYQDAGSASAARNFKTDKAGGGATITSVSPATFAVEGGASSSSGYVTVVGSSFSTTAAGAAAAVCMISSPHDKHSTTFRFGGGGYPEATGLNITFAARVQNSTHLHCTPPAVVVGGAGLLLVSMDNGSTFSNALPIRYQPLMDVAIGRRPYLSEAQGSLLLMPSPRLYGLHLRIAAALPCANWSMGWEVEMANSSTVLTFPLETLPQSINNDLRITVIGIPWRAEQLVMWRRFIRQAASSRMDDPSSWISANVPATTGSGAEPSQVDHHIQALRVKGEPFVGQGWYVYGAFAWAQRNISMLFEPVKRQAELGINMVMPYNLNDFNVTDQRLYLDWCHAAGVKVLYPMIYFTGALNKQNYGNDWASPEWIAAVSANVSHVKDHPAILAWYICDDCCPRNVNLGNTSLQAKLYSLIKMVDPYHVVSGAVQCSNLWMFSDVPTWPPAAPSVSAAAATRSGSCVPLRGTQPPLQLSLDLILTENYAQTLEAHAGDATTANGPSRDGAFRNGMARAPLVNCPGLWTGSHAFADFPGSPRQTRTKMWLAVVTTDFLSELVFLLQSTGGWLGPNTLGGGWQQTIQVAIWATQMRSLLPSFLRPFEASPHPTVNLTDVKRLLPAASTVGLPGTARMPVRARAWVEGPCPGTPMPCIHVIAVNVLADTPVEYTARVSSPEVSRLAALHHEAGVGINATRLFDASYNISLGFYGNDMILHDFIPAGEANVYEIGCTGPKPRERNDGSSPPWQRCANRRVLCWDHNAQCAGADSWVG